MGKKNSFLLALKLKKYIDVLLKIYPPFLLGLILFPALVGLFINVHAIDYRQIYLLVIWVTPFTILSLISRKKIFYYIVFTLIFIIGLVNIGFWIMSGSPVNEANLFVLYNTFFKEATDFLALKANYSSLFIIPYCVLFYFSLKHLPKLDIKLLRRHYYIALVIGVGFFGWIIKKNIQEKFISIGMPKLVTLSYDFYQLTNSYKQLENNKLNRDVGKTKGLETKQKQITVLIIGESASRGHMGLYGYKRKTNPRLSKFDSLIKYTDVISAFPLTMESIPHSLSQANIDNHLSPPKTVTLADIFNTIGFNTYWISNQWPFSFLSNRITLFAQQYDQIEFLKGKGGSDQNFYDNDLFFPFKKTLNKEKRNQLIVLHLIGSHVPYNNKYPKSFNVFSGGTSNVDELRNDYDNAVLYNDFVVDSLLKIYRNYCNENNVLGTAIYFSDHGESIYDCDDWLGHGYINGIFPKCVAEIPFLVWLSSAYRKKFPEKTLLIEGNKEKPFMTDDLFHAVIDISNIKTPTFEPSRSVFNEKYNDKRLRLFKNNHNYDEP